LNGNSRLTIALAFYPQLQAEKPLRELSGFTNKYAQCLRAESVKPIQFKLPFNVEIPWLEQTLPIQFKVPFNVEIPWLEQTLAELKRTMSQVLERTTAVLEAVKTNAQGISNLNQSILDENSQVQAKLDELKNMMGVDNPETLAKLDEALQGLAASNDLLTQMQTAVTNIIPDTPPES
jgi:hypothetical protein